MTTTAPALPGLDSYFRSQQVSLQWSLVLRALGGVLRERSGDDVPALRELFRTVGVRLSAELGEQLSGIQTLDELADTFNALWAELNWGLVELREESGAIVIEHHFAPLAEAFGVEQLEWSVGLLEGFYSEGFSRAGGGESFTARYSKQDEDGLRLTLVYAPKH